MQTICCHSNKFSHALIFFLFHKQLIRLYCSMLVHHIHYDQNHVFLPFRFVFCSSLSANLHSSPIHNESIISVWLLSKLKLISLKNVNKSIIDLCSTPPTRNNKETFIMFFWSFSFEILNRHKWHRVEAAQASYHPKQKVASVNVAQ